MLKKIRALLLTLSKKELFTLEKLLCSCEDPNIDFSETNSYTKCVDENDKIDENDVVNNEKSDRGYVEDDIDYESINSETGNRLDDGMACLPPALNATDNNIPSDSINDTAFSTNKTENISISNESNTSGYLIANQVNLNLNINTPSEPPIIVGHSLPDGDHDHSLNLVSETLSSLLNSNTNNSSDTILTSNVNNFRNDDDSVNKCTCLNSDSDCIGSFCGCYEAPKHYNVSHLYSNNLKTDAVKCKRNGFVNDSDRLISPDSGLENSEVENTLSELNLTEKINSPSTSKENSNSNSEKNDFLCDICGKVRKNPQPSNLGLIETNNKESSTSPFVNQPLKDSNWLDQCNKSVGESTDVVEERNEEWYGIATGQGDAKTSDVNFYFQNEQQSESPSQNDLQQNYWSNWEALIPFTTGSQGLFSKHVCTLTRLIDSLIQ